MKLFAVIALFSINLLAAVKPPTPVTSTIDQIKVLHFNIEMSSEEVLKIIEVGASSKVLVGNHNNPFRIDFSEKEKAIEYKYHTKYAGASPKKLSDLISKITELEIGKKNYEISCSSRSCDTAYLTANNVEYFIARFSNSDKLGNISIHQKLKGFHEASDLVNSIVSKYGEAKVHGNIKRSKTRIINYNNINEPSLNIKILSGDSHTMLEFTLSDLRIFTQQSEEISSLLSVFEKTL